MNIESNISNLNLAHLNNSRTSYDLNLQIINIKNNLKKINNNLNLTLKNLDLDDITVVNNLKLQISDLSNIIHNELV
tara:strand:+ start:346 stop:576 length:231 start_codon:yes stop_codon:yes gene_type:complete